MKKRDDLEGILLKTQTVRKTLGTKFMCNIHDKGQISYSATNFAFFLLISQSLFLNIEDYVIGVV